MKDIAIFGAGGFGKEIACLIHAINQSSASPRWNLLGFFDDSKPVGAEVSRYGKIIGNAAALNNWPTPIDIVIAIGNPAVICAIANGTTNPNVSFPNLIHPSLKMADENSFQLGKGNIIQNNCFISCDVKMGNFNVLNGDITIAHDVVIGDYIVIMPDARISGAVHIDERNLIGVGSIILQCLHIGTGVKVGAGAVMLANPKDDCTYIGNPAKKFF